MPIPAGVELVTVTDGSVPITGPDGTPLDGHFTVTGPDLATVAEDNFLFGGSGRRWVTAGLFDDLPLVATDATGVNPAGFTYTVEFTPKYGRSWTRYFSLPKALASVVLANILIPDPVAGSYSVLADPSTLLPLSGGTLAGDLTLDGSGGVPRSLNLRSSFSGGENTSDSTSRINLQSYQRWQHTADDGTTPGHFGELIRLQMMRDNAKAVVAWRDHFTDPANPYTVAGIVGHYKPNDVSDPIHGHVSIEVVDSNLLVQTRFEVRYVDENGVIGVDQCLIKTSDARFVVGADNGAAHIAAAAGTAKNLYFNNDTHGLDAGKRWGIQADTTAEPGSNVGTDFRINRYSDTGTFVDSPIFVKRSTGAVGVGGITAPAARLDVSEAGSRHTVEAIQTTTSSVSFAAFAALLGLSTNKLFDGRLVGDTAGRLVIYPNGIEIGDGTNVRDVSWKRTGAAASTITGSLTVTGPATINGQPAGQNLFVKKAADEPVTNSATVQDDDHLQVTVAANAVYEMSAMFIYDATAVADMKAGFSGPVGAALDWVTHSLDATAGSGITAVKMTAQTLSGTPSFGGIGTGAKVIAKVSGLLTVGGTGGTFKVAWAQNTADASTTTMYAGSYLSLVRKA